MIKKLAILLGTLIPLLFLSMEDHDYYFSISELDIKAKQERIELSIKCSDHSMADLLEQFDLMVSFDSLNQAQVSTQVELYLNTNFRLNLGKADLKGQLIGIDSKLNGDVIFYVEYADIPKNCKQLTLTNTLFLNHYPKQKNIVHSRVFDKTKVAKKETFYFDQTETTNIITL
ncbi:MAG: DUF6702 family protein [Flavobacteriales bacterium]